MDYKRPGFDPKKAKVVQLRRILTENGVEYGSHAKKSELVKLFNASVKAKLEGSGNSEGAGVLKMGSHSVGQPEEAEETAPLLPQKRRKQADNSTSDSSDSSSDKRRRKADVANTSLIAEKVAKKSPHKQSSSPRNEKENLLLNKFEVSSSSDKSSRESSLFVTSDDDDDETGGEKINKVTSSSPRNNDFSYKRKNLSPDLSKLKVSSEFAQQLQNAVKENLEVVNKTPQDDVKSESVESTQEEEEEEEESTQKEEEKESTDESKEEKTMTETSPETSKEEPTSPVKLGRRFKKTCRCAFDSIVSILTFALFMIPVIYALWYREQKIHIGYCGHETTPPDILANVDTTIPIWAALDDWLETQKPSCIPCPENAICYPMMKIKCKPEYTVATNKWSLYGLLPFSDSCVKDSQREKLVAEVVKKTLEFLRVKNARVSCGMDADDTKCGITEEELYQIFYESRSPWISDADFDQLWKQVVSDLQKEPEITWRQLQPNEIKPERGSRDEFKAPADERKERHLQQKDAAGNNGIFRSTSKKYVGLRCRFEGEVYRNYYRHRYLIWSIVAVMVVAKFVEYKLRKYMERQSKIKKLTKEVVEKLKETKLQQDGIPYLSIVQLRDVLLANEVNLKNRNYLWQQVATKLEQNNTNIKSSLIEVHGEIMKCWEWIGPLPKVNVDDEK